jgi:hypothetical protein
LVSVGQEGHDGSFGGFHSLGNGHAPTGVDDEQDEVGGAANPYFFSQVALLEGQSGFGVVALFLIGGSGPQGSVEGQIGDFIFFRQAGLNITAAFAVSLGAGATAGLVAGQAVELGVETAGGKFLGGRYFLPAFPPLALLGRLGDGLRPGFGLGNL